MNRRQRAPSLLQTLQLALFVHALAVPAALWAQPQPLDLLQTSREPGHAGGRLVVALRSEPKSLNPAVATDISSLTVIGQLMADLIHVDRSTQHTLPALARSWTVSPDGRTLDVELRRGIRFSDGHPLDADDVRFSFEVYLDEALASIYRDPLMVGGKPLLVRVVGPHTLTFERAEPDAWGERLFNDLAILPRHRLESAFRGGTLADAWGLETPPEEVVGLGPFRLKRYLPGRRLELERNPHYWKVDAAGQRLPYLDSLIFLFTANEDAQALRFQAGDTQVIDRLSAASFALLQREEKRRGYTMQDLGPGLGYEFLFFNMNDLSDRPLAAIEKKQHWFRNLAFRRAVSAAIDRDSLVKLVYGGRATPIATHVSPGNRLWANPEIGAPERSLATARTLLRNAGFTWNDEGRLRDSQGAAVELEILLSASSSERHRMATVIQEDLSEIGLSVQIVPLEFRTLLERIQSSFDYQACLLGFGAGDGDPNSDHAVLLANGAHRFWNLGPSVTAWEAEIDRLIRQQMTTLDPAERKRLNDRIQRTVADNLPFIFLVSPNVLVGSRRDLGNFAPAILEHHTLWNVEELFWHTPADR